MAIFWWNPPNRGVECRWGIGRNRDSGLTAGYRRLLDMWSAKNIYRRQSWVYDIVGHAPLAIDRLLDVRKTPSYRRPCSVDRTVGDAPSNVCLWRPAAWTNTPKRTEKNLIVRSGISEAETTNNNTALDVLYTDTKHRAASLRQQRSSLCCVYCYDAKIAKTTVNYIPVDQV